MVELFSMVSQLVERMDFSIQTEGFFEGVFDVSQQVPGTYMLLILNGEAFSTQTIKVQR